MAVNDVWQIVLHGELHTQVCINRYVYKQLSGAGDVVPATFKDNFVTEIVNTLLPLVSTQYITRQIVVQRIRPTPLLVPNIFAHAAAGTGEAESLPVQDAVVMNLRTQFAGPEWRGRKFYAGLPEADHQGSEITAGALVGWFLFEPKHTAVIQGAALGAAPMTPVLHSKFINKVPRDVFEPITGATVRAVIRSQRRRQKGVGV